MTFYIGHCATVLADTTLICVFYRCLLPQRNMPIHIVSKSVFFTRFVFLASCFLPVLQYIQYKCSLFTLAMRLSFLACVIDPCHLSILSWPRNTVNSEIFERILFSRNFAFAKFRENQTLANWRYHSVVY